MPLSFPSAGGASVVLQASRVLTSAEIKALHTTKIEIVAAAAGKLYVPVAAAFYYTFVTPAYTVPAGGLMLLIGTVADGPFSTFFTDGGILTASEDNIAIPIASDIQNVAQNFLANQPLSVWFGGASNPTLGNGTLKVTVDYVAVDV